MQHSLGPRWGYTGGNRRNKYDAEHLTSVEGLPVLHLIFKTLCSKYNYPHYTDEEMEAEKV